MSGARQEGDIVGDYRLDRAVSEGQLTRTWEAEQVSMQRPVMLEMLKRLASHDVEIIEAFLSDVRAKALVKHPGIGAVYEAVSNEEGTFFARERMEGRSLEGLHQEGHQFSPLEAVKLLGQISEAMLYLEKKGVATVEYGIHHFIVDQSCQVRLMNLAVEGQRDEAVSTKAKQLLGEAFDGMLIQGVPGATRVGSLCGFMADLDRPIPLTWTQIFDLSRQVRDQLEGSKPVVSPVVPPQPYEVKHPGKVPKTFWALIGGVALISGMIILVVLSQGGKKAAPAEEEQAPKPYVEIPTGEYPLGNGQVFGVRKPFSIARAEVTLAEYNVFLEFPDHSKFEHPEQPDSKKDHLPDEWKALWAAAVKGETWNGREMSTDCPVIGVDWWDAYAYAKWKVGRLPTMNEWMIAAEYEGGPQKASEWGEADESDVDVTGARLVGMAGNVREWTLQPEVNPAFPLAPKKYVVVGGSFSDGDKGVNTRNWVDSRDARSEDLGFRIISRN